MVFDSIRNEAYAKAMAAVITPDSVVLDLGAGTGILGLMAAQAGARRVYLVEPEPVVLLAREFAAANGLADRVIVMQGRIEEIELPEQVDVIVSVFTGNLLYSEDLLPALFHARDRYLKPGGKLLPHRAELWCAPWHMPSLHDDRIARWSTPAMELDVSAGRRFAANDLVALSQSEISGCALAGGLPLCQVDLLAATNADCKGEAEWQTESSGLCHGFLCWIRIGLADEWLSTDPQSPELHWMNVLLPVDRPIPLQTGDRLVLALQRPSRGEWSWKVQCPAGQRRHSTFLSRVPPTTALASLAPGHRPVLARKGVATMWVLTRMDGSHTNAALAQDVLYGFPDLFADLAAARNFVQQLALRFDQKVQSSALHEAGNRPCPLP